MADPKSAARAAAEEILVAGFRRDLRAAANTSTLGSAVLEAIISRHYAPLESCVDCGEALTHGGSDVHCTSCYAIVQGQRDEAMARLAPLEAEAAELRKEREAAMRELRLTSSYDSLVDAVRQRVQAWLAAYDNAEVMAARLSAAEKLAEAARQAHKLPRPWIDGGITWVEWEAILPALDAALSAWDASRAPTTETK